MLSIVNSQEDLKSRRASVVKLIVKDNVGAKLKSQLLLEVKNIRH